MSKHFEIMTAFRSKIDVRNSSGGFDVSLLDLPQKMLVLQLALMVADIGHCALPRDAHIRWVDRLQREFFKQASSLSCFM